MRSPSTLKPELLAELRLRVNPGQPLVVAFADALELRESPALNQIRGELRGLGAALALVARGQIFSFQPDDELDLYGTSRPVEARALAALRAACGVSARRMQTSYRSACSAATAEWSRSTRSPPPTNSRPLPTV